MFDWYSQNTASRQSHRSIFFLGRHRDTTWKSLGYQRSNTGTIYSVLTRSPSDLLDEIILVDDGSTDLRLLNELPLYIETSSSYTSCTYTCSHGSDKSSSSRCFGGIFTHGYVSWQSRGGQWGLVDTVNGTSLRCDSTSSHCVSRDYCDPSKHVETASESGSW